MTHQEIHGHEIIDIVTAHPNGISRENLTVLSFQKFGPDARFHTCTTENLDLPALLDFLAERNKIQFQSDLIFPGGTPPCNH